HCEYTGYCGNDIRSGTGQRLGICRRSPAETRSGANCVGCSSDVGHGNCWLGLEVAPVRDAALGRLPGDCGDMCSSRCARGSDAADIVVEPASLVGAPFILPASKSGWIMQAPCLPCTSTSGPRRNHSVLGRTNLRYLAPGAAVCRCFGSVCGNCSYS